MITEPRASDRFASTLALALLNIALAAIITGEADQPLIDGMEAQAAPAVAQQEIGGAIEQRFTMQPLADYHEVLSRPLFVATRHPPTAGSRSAPPPLDATLVGVILGTTDRHALVELGVPTRTTRVGEGQEIDGWTITSILYDRIVLSRAGASSEMKMQDRPPHSQPARSPAERSNSAPPPTSIQRLTAAQIPPFMPDSLQSPLQNGATARAARPPREPTKRIPR